MFFLSSFSKISDYSNVVKGFKKRFSEKLFDMPDIFYKLSIIFAIFIQFFCPLIILYSVYNPKYYMYGFYATLSLIIFTIKATYLYHFPPYGKEYYPFMGNLTTVGGLSLLAYIFYYNSSF
tara:strand:- start:303 stop:665 length:363 start_codon:yes stop_codon:yes gene_type:complete